MYRKEPVVVGHMELHERQVFSQSFETPLWTKDVAVEPGRYEVVCYDWDLEHPGSYYVHMHGVITTDYFAPRIGSSIGPYDSKKNTGKPSDISSSFYAYEYAVKSWCKSYNATFHPLCSE